jgi:hypothetical protein
MRGRSFLKSLARASGKAMVAGPFQPPLNPRFRDSRVDATPTQVFLVVTTRSHPAYAPRRVQVWCGQMQMTDILPDSWMPMAMFPPEPFETFEVRLRDGSVQRAFWTGQKWLLRGETITPACWRIPTGVAA